MKYDKINSWGKINLSLNVIKRVFNKFHRIESLVTFVRVSDEIYIRKINENNHKIIFSGKFANGIGKKNSVLRLLNILQKKK